MRDPISSATYFAKSLAIDSGHTLKTTWKGICNVGSMENPYKYTTPAIGGAGLLLSFLGVATADPVAVTLGLANVGIAAGHFLENGENVLSAARIRSGKPPEPPSA